METLWGWEHSPVLIPKLPTGGFSSSFPPEIFLRPQDPGRGSPHGDL